MKTFLTLMALCLSFFVMAQDREFHLDERYEIDTKGTLHMDTDDADITITGTQRSDVHVVVDWTLSTSGVVRGDKTFRVDVKERNGDIHIQQQEQGNLNVVGSSREDYTISVEVPEGVSLNLRGDDDDYIIRNIGGAISLDNDDGDARFENCGGSTFRFNIDDGDIHMEGGSGELHVDIDDGSFEVLGGKFSVIKASTDDGDLHIETSLSAKGTYDIDANDADLELSITSGGGKFYIRHDDGSIRTEGPFTMIKEDEHIMELSLEKGEGEASVKISSDDSEVSLNALR